ncbi:MAG: hypothetical protein K6G23_08660 [Lachnospiraceae bacterium]|nr:hypothetical protein [Lachnospiraceae bacterium]
MILILYIWRVTSGARAGLVGEIGNLADICIVSFLIVDAIAMFDNIINKNLVSFLTSGVIFLVVLIARKAIKAAFALLEWIVKFPILNRLNLFFGIVAGVFEATILVWVFYAFHPYINAAFPNNNLVEQIAGNTFLSWLYLHNGLGTLVTTLSGLLKQFSEEH